MAKGPHTRILGNRDILDFYPTDQRYVAPLLRHCYFYYEDAIHDPCCGSGSIVKFLRNNGYTNVIASDKVNRGFDCSLIDVFDQYHFDNVICNPPYKKVEKLVHHVLSKAHGKVAFLLKLDFLGSKTRYNLFKEFPPLTVIVIAERMKVFGHSSQFTHCWVVWDTTLESSESIQTMLISETITDTSLPHISRKI